MLRRLPPLNALKAFEAAARHESFTRAAEELFVTQGAVSHQVKALEAELGVKLFNRERQRLVITEAGREYLTSSATPSIASRSARNGCCSGRALACSRSARRRTLPPSGWSTGSAVSRRSIPSIDLRVSATMHHVDFAREDVDIAVRHGDGNWPGLDVARLARGAVSGLQSQAARAGATAEPSRLTCSNSRCFISTIARTGRDGWRPPGSRRRALAWSRAQSREHGDRCRGRWPGHRACAHHAGSMGSDHRATDAAVSETLRLSKTYWIVCPKATGRCRRS